MNKHPQRLSISLTSKVKVVTMAYDTLGSFSLCPTSLTWAITTLSFAALLQIPALIVPRTQQAPTTQPWPGMFSSQIPRMFVLVFFSGLFLNVILLQRPSLNTLYKKATLPPSPPEPLILLYFSSQHVTTSTALSTLIFWFVFSISPHCKLCGSRNCICLAQVLILHHLEHVLAHGKHLMNSCWMNGGMDTQEGKWRESVNLIYVGGRMVRW